MNDTSTKHVFLKDENACLGLAEAVTKLLQIGDILYLEGPLGSGKTTFVKALVRALNGDVTHVQSPTYTLMHSYEADMPIIHIDAYRLKHAHDLDALGFNELQESAISCIEWPSKVGINNDAHSWFLKFSHVSEHERNVEITAPATVNFEWAA